MASVILTVNNVNIKLSTLSDSATNAGFTYNILSDSSLIVNSSNKDILNDWKVQYENNPDLSVVFNIICPTNCIKKTMMRPATTLKSANVSYFNMSQIRTIYKIPAPNPDIPVVIGVLSFGGGMYGNVDSNGVLTNGDVQNYWSSIGIPTANHPKVIIVPINGASNNPNVNDSGATIENTIDIETLGGACPSANLTIILYISPNSLSAFYPLLNYVINTPVVVNSVSYKPTIISCSWGASEIYFDSSTLSNIRSLLQVASSNGINMCTATGDFGSNNNVGGTGSYCDFPSSCPFVTAVGGTTLTCPNYVYDNSTIEVAWSSGGGGISTAFPKPAYQSAISVSGRSIPDVALVADPNTGVVYIINGALELIGGTSIAAPMVAGFLATINPTKFINPLLYTANANCFNDIKSGSNGAYSAFAGYDSCTGLGSINGANLSLVLSNITASSISLAPTSLTLPVGQTSQLTTTILPVNVSTRTLIWSVTDSTFATVDSSGLVTAVAPGSVTITASTTDGSNLSASCTVTITPSDGSVPVSGISLNTSNVRLNASQTYQLIATVNPSNATNKNVLWTTNSSNGSVSSTGLVTANSVGNFQVTATTENGGFTARANFIVTVAVTGVSIATSNYNLIARQTVTLRPIVSPENASNKSLTFSSSNTNVATVNSSGIVLGVGTGTSTITITTVDGGFTTTALINVSGPLIPVSRIVLNQTGIKSLIVGQTFQAVATIIPVNATNKVLNWSSSNPNCASVSSSGLVTALANGSTLIRATSTDRSNRSAFFTINVTTNVTGVTLNINTLTLPRNSRSQLVASVLPSTASNKLVRWSSNNPSVVSVRPNGLITAVRTGTATITVATLQGNYMTTCVVTVT